MPSPSHQIEQILEHVRERLSAVYYDVVPHARESGLPGARGWAGNEPAPQRSAAAGSAEQSADLLAEIMKHL